MIELLSGTPGSGKSLDAAAQIRYALTKPRGVDQPVIANFPCNVQGFKRANAFHYMANDDITPGFLCDFADTFWATCGRPFSEDYIILVLDECQLVFNSRNWMDKGVKGRGNSRMDWLEFLSQHRKYGYKILLIAQSAKMIDNQFRMLIETEVNHRKVSNMGFLGSVIGALFRGLLFMRVRYLFQTNERLGMRLYLGRRRDMAVYDSYTRLKQVRAGAA